MQSLVDARRLPMRWAIWVRRDSTTLPRTCREVQLRGLCSNSSGSVAHILNVTIVPEASFVVAWAVLEQIVICNYRSGKVM